MVKVRIPATTANLGCGFDTFGLALGYYNYIEMELAENTWVTVKGQGQQRLAKGANNMIVRAAARVADRVGVKTGFSLQAENNIPLSRGMGSSSAAIVGGMYAANYLLGEPLSIDELFEMAVEMEGHPDNVAPAIYGGFTISYKRDGKYGCRKLEAPKRLTTVLAVPEVTVSTKAARGILPQEVSLADAVYNLGQAAMLATSVATGDLEAFGASLTDKLHQPYRMQLIPGAEQVMENAVKAGAVGAAISGSGSTMIAFCNGRERQQAVAAAMREAFTQNDVEARIIFAGVDNCGVKAI
ncbi:MAG: homoserine kinase [Firmicutes bacterium]|nr:homoserine kinase [Bacillota bacterium]